jgi:hypothetical protein
MFKAAPFPNLGGWRPAHTSPICRACAERASHAFFRRAPPVNGISLRQVSWLADRGFRPTFPTLGGVSGVEGTVALRSQLRGQLRIRQEGLTEFPLSTQRDKTLSDRSGLTVRPIPESVNGQRRRRVGDRRRRLTQ